jgi:hypothetical protein
MFYENVRNLRHIKKSVPYFTENTTRPHYKPFLWKQALWTNSACEMLIYLKLKRMWCMELPLQYTEFSSSQRLLSIKKTHQLNPQLDFNAPCIRVLLRNGHWMKTINECRQSRLLRNPADVVVDVDDVTTDTSAICTSQGALVKLTSVQLRKDENKAVARDEFSLTYIQRRRIHGLLVRVTSLHTFRPH